MNLYFQNVVDFGCGRFKEFLVYAKPEEYTGIDINISQDYLNPICFIKADYRKIKKFSDFISPNITSFVSLFSTEITAPREDNYKFYERIFNELPSIQLGLVSGFYYSGRKNQNPIVETGGVVSFQTLDNVEDVTSDIFTEKRVILPVPSEMFGKDVFEVWKFFARKDN
jgi:hypothetical protein